MKNSIKTTILSFILLVCIVGVSCSSCNADVVGSTNSSSSAISGTYSSFIDGWITDDEARATVVPSADQMPATYDAADFVYEPSEYTQVEIDLSNPGSSYANEDITVETNAEKTTITLGNSAKYNIVLSGASEVGVTIASDYDFVLTLDNVAISSKDGSDEQALKTKGSATCFLVLVGESTLTGCTDESGETNTNGMIVVPSETEHAAGHGIYLNGSVKYTEGNVPLFNIEGASITANSTGIYAAGYGKWNIKDTTINGVDTAIEIRAGEMDIECGTFTASAVPTEVTPNGNGTTSSGSAMAVAQHTTKLPIAVSISGGTFEGYSALYESNPQNNDEESIAKVNLEITGGVFNAVNGGSVAVFSQDCKGFISGGSFNVAPDASYYAEGYSAQ